MDSNNQYGTLKVQEYLLPILVDIDFICRKYAIQYTISDGTLLGAVRHKGFIPWDDDVDVSFDRKNFEKFIEIAKERLPSQYTIVYDTWIHRISRKDNQGCIDLYYIR